MEIQEGPGPLPLGGANSTAQQPDAVFKVAAFVGRAIANSKKTTNCIREEIILQADGAEMRLERK